MRGVGVGRRGKVSELERVGTMMESLWQRFTYWWCVSGSEVKVTSAHYSSLAFIHRPVLVRRNIPYTPS
jgi:hypothetical protein